MPRIALYAGSFDPVTNGHLDVVRLYERYLTTFLFEGITEASDEV